MSLTDFVVRITGARTMEVCHMRVEPGNTFQTRGLVEAGELALLRDQRSEVGNAEGPGAAISAGLLARVSRRPAINADGVGSQLMIRKFPGGGGGAESTTIGQRE
jgi:hypothetical protein